MTLNSTHLGLNIWRQLVAKNPISYLRSGNALLLCFNDDEQLLHHFFLTQSDGLSSISIVMQACVTLAKGIGASALIRIQAHSAYETDPFQINSSATKGLYAAIKLHNLCLTEVVLPNFL